MAQQGTYCAGKDMQRLKVKEWEDIPGDQKAKVNCSSYINMRKYIFFVKNCQKLPRVPFSDQSVNKQI